MSARWCLQELGQARDTPDDIVFDHLQSAVFKGQPLGWPILGEEKTVESFSREILWDYMASQYRPRGHDTDCFRRCGSCRDPATG